MDYTTGCFDLSRIIKHGSSYGEKISYLKGKENCLEFSSGRFELSRVRVTDTGQNFRISMCNEILEKLILVQVHARLELLAGVWVIGSGLYIPCKLRSRYRLMVSFTTHKCTAEVVQIWISAILASLKMGSAFGCVLTKWIKVGRRIRNTVP